MKSNPFFPSKSTTIGGISFYYSEGEPRMRRAGGPSKNQVKNRASCAGIRSNNTEFDGATKLCKYLRTCMGREFKHYADSYISGRMTGLFREIILKGKGRRGQRAFNPIQHQGIECNRHRSFDAVWEPAIELSVSEDASCCILQTHVSAASLHAPAEATHVQLALFSVAVPVLEYNAEWKEYRCADGKLLRACFKNHAAKDFLRISLTDSVPVPVSLKVPALPAAAEEATEARVFFVGVAFYKGEKPLKEGAAMKLICMDSK